MSVVTTITPGDLGADYVALAGSVTIERLLAENKKFVIRYIARSTTIGKIVTPAEIAALHAAGIAVLLNYEGSANDISGGATAGASNGAFSRQFAKNLGYPDECPLFVSVDTNVDPSRNNVALATAYTRAFMAAASPSRPGVYGDTDIMRAVADLNPINWRANATAWGPNVPGLTIHVQQGIGANALDPNVCQAAFPAWLPQKADNMPARYIAKPPVDRPGNPPWFLKYDGAVSYATNGDDSYPEVVLPPEQYDWLYQSVFGQKVQQVAVANWPAPAPSPLPVTVTNWPPPATGGAAVPTSWKFNGDIKAG